MLFESVEHECPNCHSKFPKDTRQVYDNSKGEARYSLLRGEDYLDEDAVAYVDAGTSEEQVGVTSAANVKDDKGKETTKL